MSYKRRAIDLSALRDAPARPEPHLRLAGPGVSGWLRAIAAQNADAEEREPRARRASPAKRARRRQVRASRRANR